MRRAQIVLPEGSSFATKASDQPALVRVTPLPKEIVPWKSPTQGIGADWPGFRSAWAAAGEKVDDGRPWQGIGCCSPE
jgi:hypothetical protein